MWVFLWGLLGLSMGSFANVLVYRIPKQISIIRPSSKCPSCEVPIAFYDLLPLVSWAVLKGRCRHCNANISLRYPFTELACALLFMGMALFTMSLSVVFLSVFGFVLLTVSLIDWDTQELPDGLLLVAFITGVLWVAAGHFTNLFPKSPGFFDAGLGILAGAAPLLVIDRLVLALAKKDGFGYGDVKLMAVAGIFLGWSAVIVAFFFAFISGGVYAVYLRVTGRAEPGAYLAFGPFLCGGVIAALWFGQVFWNLIT